MKVTCGYFLKRYRQDYCWGILMLLATNALAASIPLMVKRLIDSLYLSGEHSTAATLGSIGAIVIVMFLARVASRFFLIGVGRKVEFEARMQLFRHLLSMPRSFFDTRQTGELMSRLTNDLASLRMFLGGGIMLLINAVFAYLLILPLMMMLSWQLTLVAFLFYPLIIGIMRFLSRQVRQLSHRVQDRIGDITALAQENFSGIGVIQSYAKEKEESARFYDASVRYFDANIRLVKMRALLYVLIAMISGFSLLMILGEGGREVIAGSLSLSSLAAFMLYLERLSWPTTSFGWILTTMQQGIAATERINELLEMPSSVTDAEADFSLEVVPSGPLEIRNLSFRYRNPYCSGNREKTDSWALRNISLVVQPGELLAIVGPIGSGKSTLLNLLVRLYELPPESVFVGGIPIEWFPLSVLRQGITLMPQSSFLFSTSIRENIAYGDPEASMDSVTETARIARLHDEIMEFCDAYQTLVGERGITLSGGQRQRCTLARTLLASPAILLLDDPFSNLDAATEQAIIAALQERHLLRERTTIFTSHRFSLVQQADRIVVLNCRGEIEAVGTHAQLLESSVLYRSLSKSMAETPVSGQEETVG